MGGASGDVQQWDGYMGFFGDKGLRKTTPGPALFVSDFNQDDWTQDPNGDLRYNGVSSDSASILDPSVILAERDSLWRRERFYLGGYHPSIRTFSSYDFAEVLVYDSVLPTAHKERLESYLALKYGITLSHRYFASDWNGAGTIIYDSLGGYSQEIAGIGRDDVGQLNQKQSRSINPKAIVSLALNAHATFDTLNTSVFENNMKFMAAGANRATDSCWTTLDIRVNTPEAGIHQRIPKEWKMMYTGTWATDAVEVVMKPDVIGYNVPPLPPGATTYYMYLDNNGNFSDGGTTAIPMTLSGGDWETTIQATDLPTSPFYFTFGTKMDSTLHGHLVRCKGREIKVYGSRLANVCTGLTLKSGATQYRADRGAVVADNKFVVAFNATKGCIDTLTWQAPNVAIAGTYRLLIDTIAGPVPDSTCLIASFGPPANIKGGLVRQVQIDTGEVADISWPGDSIYCSNGQNVLPIFGPGCSPGVFSYLAGPLLPASTNLLLPNTTTGQLLVHSGSVGIHTIKFKTIGASSCKDSAQAVINIRPVTTPTISYPNSPYCGGTALSDPATRVGTPGGHYYSAPGLVFDDTTTGVIDLPASAPGTYTVFYAPHPDSCANIASTTVVVNAPERAYFDYPDTVLCLGAAAELPLIQYRPSSGGFSMVSGTGTLILDLNTGAINLGTSTAGFYVVQYGGITGSCTYAARDSFRIKAPTNATFSLANDTLCLNSPMFIPTGANPNGYFTSFNNLIGIQPDSMTVNPAASTPGGPYDLVFILPDTFCSDTFALPMFFRGVAAASLTYSDTSLCENQPNPFPVFLSGTAGGSFYSTNGAVFVDSLTGELDVTATTVGAGYNVFYTVPDPSCPDTVLVATINIDSIPTPDFQILTDSVCQNSGFYEIDVHRVSGYSFSLFIGPNQVPGGIVGDSINVDILPAGGPYMIQNIQTTSLCQDTAYDFITIVEQDSAGIIFTPPIICLNDNDPFPLITGDGGGIFSLGLSPSFVPVDPDSGIMTLDTNMVLGIYWVVYQTQGLCSDVDSAFVDIRNNISAQYNYFSLEYCQADTTPVAPEPGFATGGVFSTDSIGLVWIDSITGVFDRHNSLPGTYLIKYTISSAGACEATWTDRVVIVEKDTITTLTYNGSPYCPSDTDPHPILTNSVDTLGLFSGIGVYFSDQDRGIISLQATAPGSYTVFYAKRTVCEEIFDFPIVVKPEANAFFSYPDQTVCIGPNNPMPDSISNMGGTFTALPDTFIDNMSIDPVTGEIDLFSTSEGNYLITYTIDTSGILCGGVEEFEMRVLPQPTGIDLLSNHPNDTICENTFVLFTAAGADLVQYFLNGDSVGSGTTWEGYELDSGDVVQALFTTALQCKDSITRVMHVFDIPEATVLSAPSILSGTDSLEIQVQLLTDNSWLEWEVEGIGAVTFSQDDGRSIEADSGMIIPIGNTVYLESEIDPAQFTFTVVPTNFLCKGTPETVTIRVNPNDRDVFVPQVITPDGNGANDSWMIQLKNGIDPAKYTIQLFNSAGALVHTMTPLNDLFTGESSDAGYLMDGVYWYLLLDEKGEKLEAGGLTIRRK